MKRNFISCLFSVAVLAGCGGSNEDLPDTAPVSGSVTHNGKPLVSGTITFHPQGEGNPAYGEIKEDGTYRLTTYEAHDGAVLGTHIVTVEVFASPDGGPAPLPGSEADLAGAVPAKYSSPDSSPLRYTVKAGDNTASFPLEG